MDKAAYLGFVVEVVKRTPGQTGFQPVAKRWVVDGSLEASCAGL